MLNRRIPLIAAVALLIVAGATTVALADRDDATAPAPAATATNTAQASFAVLRAPATTRDALDDKVRGALTNLGADVATARAVDLGVSSPGYVLGDEDNVCVAMPAAESGPASFGASCSPTAKAIRDGVLEARLSARGDLVRVNALLPDDLADTAAIVAGGTRTPVSVSRNVVSLALEPDQSLVVGHGDATRVLVRGDQFSNPKD